MVEEEKKKEIRGKKQHKNKPSGRKYKMYKIDGNKIIRKKICPRCGPGVFLAATKERLYCGKCHYTEFTGETRK
jgi:small subunit ribosomal protein S27Ae